MPVWGARRVSATVLALLLVGMSLGACSNSVGNSTPANASATGSPDPILPADPPKAVLVSTPNALPADTLANLQVKQVSGNSKQEKWSTSFATYIGGDTFTATLEAYVTELAEDETARRSLADGGEFNSSWEITLAVGQVMAERISSLSSSPHRGVETTARSYYVNVATGEHAAADELFTASGVEQATQAIAQALQSAGKLSYGQVGKPNVNDVQPDRQLLADTTFLADGRAVVILPQGVLTVRSEGQPAVALDAQLVKAALNEYGRKFYDEVLTHQDFVGLPEPPPEPTPQPAPAGGTVDCQAVPCIALTFDDGPGADTKRLLDVLGAAKIRATFFMVGRSVSANPAVAKMAADAGHAVGGHSWSHADFTRLTPEAIATQITQTDAALAAAGVPPANFMRPPYGAVNPQVMQVLANTGKAAIMWNVDTEDWKNKNVEVTTQRALATAKPGAIILMHDIHPSTVDAVPGIIAQLQASGYHLVTVPELLGTVNPGQKYFNRPANN